MKCKRSDLHQQVKSEINATIIKVFVTNCELFNGRSFEVPGEILPQQYHFFCCTV